MDFFRNFSMYKCLSAERSPTNVVTELMTYIYAIAEEGGGRQGQKKLWDGVANRFGGDMAKYFGVGRQEIFEGGVKKILVDGNFLGAGSLM